jgi:MFS family permease
LSFYFNICVCSFFQDLLAPEDKIGYVQGLNNAAMNFGMATAPWLLGLLADSAGTNTAIWTGVGISFGAALINTPLMFHKGYGPAEKKKPRSKMALPGEDTDLIEKALGMLNLYHSIYLIIYNCQLKLSHYVCRQLYSR